MKRIVSAAIAALLFLCATPIQAHTIGFEFEDYVHVWPGAAPPGDVNITYPAPANTNPSITIRADSRNAYNDLEVHVGPFDTADYASTWFANYTALYVALLQAAPLVTTVQTLANKYNYKTVDTFRNGSTDYPLGYVTTFLNGTSANKTLPVNPPLSDVGAQATFSLGTREVYQFFHDARFPFFRQDTIDRIAQYDRAVRDVRVFDDCASSPGGATPYGCSLRARGFTFFLAEYLNNTVGKMNTMTPDGYVTIKKDSYPLLLRNIAGGINGVKEYFNIIVRQDAYLTGHRQEFVDQLKALLPNMVAPTTENTEVTTRQLVDAYVDFLAGRADVGFEFGPRDGMHIYRFTFTTLGEAQDAVIRNPLADEIYLECRSVRTLTTARVAALNPRSTINVNTYAIPYTDAVTAAQTIAQYLRDFHRATGI